MHDALEQHRERLMSELRDQGVEISRGGLRSIDELFDGADEAFSETPERVDELSENTDKLVEALASASAAAEVVGAGSGDNDFGSDDDRVNRPRYLDVTAVREVIIADCLWPFCRQER